MKKVFALSFNNYQKMIEENKLNDSNIEHARGANKTAFIQICGVEDREMHFVLKSCSNVLSLSFDDVDEQVEVPLFNPSGVEYVQVYPMNEEQAKQIVDFVQKNEDKEVFIVHCKAGQSRSGGVAKFISEYFKIPEREFNLSNPFTHPNRRIIKMLKDELNNNTMESGA